MTTRRFRVFDEAQRARLTSGDDDVLISAERRIAELVAPGHSNPEIATTLHISVKTVEANLTRTYRKLGVRSRVGLARHNLDSPNASSQSSP